MGFRITTPYSSYLLFRSAYHAYHFAGSCFLLYSAFCLPVAECETTPQITGKVSVLVMNWFLSFDNTALV